MTIEIVKGTQGQFLEVETEERVVRLFAPPINDFQGRLQALIQKHPNLTLVRTGLAVVSNATDLPNPISAITTVPSRVEKTLTLDFMGNHPHVMQGPANYSPEFISEMMKHASSATVEEQPEQGQTSVYDELPVEPKAVSNPLTQQLMAQVKGPGPVAVQERPFNPLQEKFNQQLKAKTEPAAKTEVETTVIPLKKADDADKIVSETEKTLTLLQQKNAQESETKKAPLSLEQAVARKRTQQAEPPKGKLDILLEQVAALHDKFDDFAETHEPEITGAELKDWFEAQVEEMGEEATFEALAEYVRF